VRRYLHTGLVVRVDTGNEMNCFSFSLLILECDIPGSLLFIAFTMIPLRTVSNFNMLISQNHVPNTKSQSSDFRAKPMSLSFKPQHFRLLFKHSVHIIISQHTFCTRRSSLTLRHALKPWPKQMIPYCIAIHALAFLSTNP
jgi:hypothetical protein